MTIQVMTDKLAIGLSAMCTIHCLVLPVLLVLLPSMSALGLDNEEFHLWMLFAVVPSSVYALTLGCKQHKHYRLFIYGFIGLTLLISAVLLEHYIGETGEKLMTVLGSCFVAFGHLSNYKLCQSESHKDCDCTDEKHV